MHSVWFLWIHRVPEENSTKQHKLWFHNTTWLFLSVLSTQKKTTYSNEWIQFWWKYKPVILNILSITYGGRKQTKVEYIHLDLCMLFASFVSFVLCRVCVLLIRTHIHTRSHRERVRYQWVASNRAAFGYFVYMYHSTSACICMWRRWYTRDSYAAHVVNVQKCDAVRCGGGALGVCVCVCVYTRCPKEFLQ